ncbi:MAG: tRNA pseudouridine(55) synthase TruB [Bdellovibrionaceae bacterium]|nr:tRNA pseudouridine(55) synthase TruB [Pseudobdellovibrionaceae bacterium]
MSISKYSGLLLIDKPVDLTSHDVVYKIRKKYKVKVGHCGTLDPFASGLLVLVLGEATKIASYISSNNKYYNCEILLGQTSDTLDITGECKTTALQKELLFSEMDIKKAIKKLTGKISLEVPMYSAVKVKGKKLYEYARENKNLEKIPIREMNFLDVQFLSYKDNILKITMKVSSGTYVRAWAKALGEYLKVGGLVKSLRRVTSSPYNLNQAMDLPTALHLNLSENNNEDSWNKAFIPINKTLLEMDKIFFSSKEAHLLKNGQIPHSVENALVVAQRQAQKLKESHLYVCLNKDEELLGILEIAISGKLSIKRIMAN